MLLLSTLKIKTLINQKKSPTATYTVRDPTLFLLFNELFGY